MALRFGAFIAPVHNIDENPTLLLRQDLELIQHLDRIGFDEVWVGEHHSGGAEIIASPEIMLAAAAELTKHIRLGTGVVTLPYHNPFMVASRIVQLDHLLRGRLMFGVGAGALAYDAHMIGVGHNDIRDRLDVGLGVIKRLFNGEQVTERNDWFNLQDARLQLLPYQSPHMELAIPVVNTAAGAMTAAKFGASILSIAATTAKGFEALPVIWRFYEDTAAEHKQPASRETWRLVGPVHIAETREQARRDVRYGLPSWLRYFAKIGTLPISGDGSGDIDSEIDGLLNSGLGVIGTPDDLRSQIDRLAAQAGGFGCYLNMHHNWADFAATKKSYDLIARYVKPKYDRQNAQREKADAWAREKHEEFTELRKRAAQKVPAADASLDARRRAT
jgi:limonene 1,2-monooxygenase